MAIEPVKYKNCSFAFQNVKFEIKLLKLGDNKNINAPSKNPAALHFAALFILYPIYYL